MDLLCQRGKFAKIKLCKFKSIVDSKIFCNNIIMSYIGK